MKIGVFRDSDNAVHPVYAYSTKEIDQYSFVNAQFAERVIAKAAVHDTIRAAYAEFDREKDRVHAAYDASGLHELGLESDHLCNEACDKLAVAMETTPTTMAGLIALVSYAAAGNAYTGEGFVGEGYDEDFLAHISASLAKLV